MFVPQFVRQFLQIRYDSLEPRNVKSIYADYFPMGRIHDIIRENRRKGQVLFSRVATQNFSGSYWQSTLDRLICILLLRFESLLFLQRCNWEKEHEEVRIYSMCISCLVFTGTGNKDWKCLCPLLPKQKVPMLLPYASLQNKLCFWGSWACFLCRRIDRDVLVSLAVPIDSFLPHFDTILAAVTLRGGRCDKCR